jgi:hypothetical protein
VTSDGSGRGREQAPGPVSAARVAALVAALLLLNVSLTFANIWPTLGIALTADLSLETAALLLGLVAARRLWNGPSPVALRWLAGLWVLLVIGRYTEMTVASLYGRNISLYWDLQHVSSVSAMFAVVTNPWLKVAIIVGVPVGLLSLYLGARWSMGVLAAGTRELWVQRLMGPLAAAALLLGLVQTAGARLPVGLGVASPVTAAYARELGEFAYELSGAGVRDLGPPPVLRSDLSRLGGADVFVIFLESYGAVAWQRPHLAEPLAPAMARLDADIVDTGRAVASALVESTTFGGESWLAHVSLLSGTEIRDPATNVRLMAQERDTMVKLFGRGGYRTVAIMPGMLVAWPEGAFYGFDQIYDHDGLGYLGPQFGWWDINDQYALARVDALEIEPPREHPAFVFFTTISTHTPFVPAPPYQPDWARMLTTDPYDTDALDRAWSAWPDWTDLGPSYLEAFDYALRNIGGYLRFRADRDLVLVLVGDHQPPALVSGAGASWNVPVHVIASRPAVLDRLRDRHRFTDTLHPGGESVARMDTLLPILLDAFGDGGAP